MLVRLPLRPSLLVSLAMALPAQRPEGAAAAPPANPIDEAAITFLRQHGLEQSQVMEHLSWMCDVYGPRLSGSPNLRKAQQWAVAAFTGFGLQNAHTEEWGPFGRGWRMDRCVVEVIGDNPWPVIAYAKSWVPSMGPIDADCVLVADLDADSLRDMDLTGKIVLTDTPRDVNEPFDGTSKRYDAEGLLTLADQAQPRGARGAPPAGVPAGIPAPAGGQDGFTRRQAMQRILAEKKTLALVDRGSKGDYGTVFVQGASAQGQGGARVADAVVVPQFTMAVEHYNRICRILKKGLPVRLHVEVKVSFFDDNLMEYNVLAEIPGTDPALKDQVVMLGGHFDSWHTGTGATDNGCGSAVAMEAARLLAKMVKDTGLRPRRTIRAALWSGEEQGLLGSRAYVQQHFGERGVPNAEHGKLAGYFNLDNGTGRVRGIYLQGNEACGPIFRAWLKPFHDLDARTITMNNTGGTDHGSFDGVGLPGFQFIQDPVSYDSKTHHSNMDVWDHAIAADLKQAATIMAAFVWHTAQRDEMLPRKPLPQPGEAGGRRGRGR